MVADAYDFWVFDLDGTLVDVHESYALETLDDVGDRLGYDFSDRGAMTLWHGLGGTRNEILMDRGIDPEQFWRVFDVVADPVSRAEATFLYDDGRIVDRLDRPVGIVTHCPRGVVELVLERLDIDGWFDVVVCCDDETGLKPDPGPVERAMERMEVTSAESGVLVGDAAADVGAAWNAGLDGVHLERHDPEHRGRCILGDARIRSLDEIQ